MQHKYVYSVKNQNTRIDHIMFDLNRAPIGALMNNLDHFSPYICNSAVFVPDADSVVKYAAICGCGFADVGFYVTLTRFGLRLFDSSLLHISI